jgi:hypothetical protein
MPNDKYEEIENEDLQTPGVRPDDDVDVDDGMDLDEPDTVGARHLDEDPESGKGGLEKEMNDDDRIPQDSDPSE